MPNKESLSAELCELEETLKNFVVHKPEIYSRVVGYFRPVQQWNKAKQHEFNERKLYELT